MTKAAGVRPLLSPPVTAATFAPSQLAGYDFIYFKLHGLLRESYWYGDNWQTALTVRQIADADLSSAVVFVANCFLWEPGPDPTEKAPMLRALLEAGARAVVGGPGENYARKQTVMGADRLGRDFRITLALGLAPSIAFKLAHKRYSLQAKHKLKRPNKLTKNEQLALKDTLEFRYFGGKI